MSLHLTSLADSQRPIDWSRCTHGTGWIMGPLLEGSDPDI